MKRLRPFRLPITAVVLYAVLTHPWEFWFKRQSYINGEISYMEYIVSPLMGLCLCYCLCQIIECLWLTDN